MEGKRGSECLLKSVSNIDFNPTSTDAVTGTKTTTPTTDSLGHQANPVLTGYTVTSNPTEATTDQTVKNGDTNVDITVVYTKNAPTVTTNTITKTVHYVDADGNKLAEDYISSVMFNTSTDALIGDTTTTPSSDTLSHQENPTIEGYTLTTNPAEATTDQIVTSGDANVDVTVVYTKDQPAKVTKTDALSNTQYEVVKEASETVKPVTVVSNTDTVKSEQSKNQPVLTTTNKQSLPQTNEKGSSIIMIAGVALLMFALSIIGIETKKSRKN